MTNKETQTELEIAKESIDAIKHMISAGGKDAAELICQTHKSSCQRFLEFMREINLWEVVSSNSVCLNEVEEKITDLKSAIEEYEKNGI